MKDVILIKGESGVSIQINKDYTISKIEGTNKMLTREHILELVQEITEMEVQRWTNLILWAYQQGMADGISEFKEDTRPTEQSEWERTR